MESQSACLSSSPFRYSHLATQKLACYKPIALFPAFISFSSKPLSVFNGTRLSSVNKIALPTPTNPLKPLQNHHFLFSKPSLFQELAKTHLPFALTQLFLTTLPSFALETEQASDKINLESILLAIDDFFNSNPFFVAGCTFIWLVVIPIIEYYFRKYKFISAIDAFRKIQDDPSAQLLDIRDEKSLSYLRSPNLKILNKAVVQVPYSEEDEDEFVKNVTQHFEDTANTVVCVLDNFDGNSMKVAELLFKNGFKEAYAIKGGVGGENGWLAIQESLLPPSVHMYRRKKAKASQKFGMNGGVIQQTGENEGVPSSEISIGENQQSRLDIDALSDTNSQLKTRSRPSSPYPNYPDLKPPSSPTPSKPGN